MASELILVSAAAFETKPLRDLCDGRGLSYQVFETGIGPLNASESIHQLASVCYQKPVVFIGTCGVFGSFDGVELVRPNRVHWLPAGERLGFAYSISGLHKPYSLNGSTSHTKLSEVDVICSPTISIVAGGTFPDQQRRYVENLELYSCMNGLEKSKKLLIVLAVTNAIGPDAHRQWRSHHEEAAVKSSEFVIELWQDFAAN